MDRADYVLCKRHGRWAVDCSGKEFGPYDSWFRAARMAINQARWTHRVSQIRVEGANGRCYVARRYDGQRLQ